MEMTLLDTNILIEFLKGNPQTIQQLETIDDPLAISVITQMELFYGALNKRELKQLDMFTNSFEIIHITPSISRHATALIKEYAKSHNLDIPDSLIAATAIVNSLPLFTYNTKDSHFIEGLRFYHAS